MLRVQKSSVVKLFERLGYRSAETWSDQKLSDKLSKMAEMYDDEDITADDLEDGDEVKLLNDLVKAARNEEEVDLLPDADFLPEDDEEEDDDFGAVDPKPEVASEAADDDDDVDEDEESAEELRGLTEVAATVTEEFTKAAETEVAHAVTVGQHRSLTDFALDFASAVNKVIELWNELVDVASAGQISPPESPVQTETKAAKPKKESNATGTLTDVIAAIKEFVGGRKTRMDGVSFAQVFSELQERFPNRDPEWLREKLDKQLPDMLRKRDKMDVKHEDGVFWVNG